MLQIHCDEELYLAPQKH
uniref:Uncharacterized protein n=1 Tax=Rhizophora mucronata TaxID=61149 RepID=A0A2P2Q8Y0_RHIMU